MITQTHVGAFEAKTHFSQLIERTLQGEEIFITRRGKVVAKLVPVQPLQGSPSAQDAALRLRTLAQEMQLGPFHWDEWKEYRDEGRA